MTPAAGSTSQSLPTLPTGSSLQRLAEQAAERTGAQSRLLFEGSDWTGLALATRARRLSGGLRQAGLAAGDRVVVCMANCPEVGIAYQAVWRAGAAVTPVLFLLREDELRHVLIDSGATLAVTTTEFLPKLVAAASGVDAVRGIVVVGDVPQSVEDPRVLRFGELEVADEAPLVDRDPSELAALLYTGGTTGRAKGVMLSHDAVSSSAWAAASRTVAQDIRVSLLPLPLSHVYGLLVSVLGLHNPHPGTSVLMRWFDAAGWLQLAAKHAVQSSPVVPSMLQLLLAQPLENYDLSALRRVSSGGAPLPREVAESFNRRLPHVELTEGYGCTESAAIIATTPPGQRRPGSVGLAAPGSELRIETEDGDDAQVGTDGEICVRGPMVMDGYWHAPEETSQVLRDGWLHTGDIGHLDADGYLYVVDRIKDLIIRGGFNVYPRDAEDVLLTHPEVVACAVVGRPDPTYGEEVVAFVQLIPGSSVTPGELVRFGKQRLASNKYPRDVRIVDAVPLTSVGKTDRKALRSRVGVEGAAR